MKLMDIFANFTKERPLSELWPHLLGRSNSGDPDRVESWEPTSLLSRMFRNNSFMFLFLIGLYSLSIVPYWFMYSEQYGPQVDPLLSEIWPVLSLRGAMIACLLLVLQRRNNMIEMFRNERAFSEVFKIGKKKKGLVYWMNFAVCRFTGFQKKGKLVTFNSVMVAGGGSSLLMLLVAWLLARMNVSSSGRMLDPLDVVAELMFWVPVSYIFGIVVWNLSVVPLYVFDGIKNIDMNTAGWRIQGFDYIRRVGLYCVNSILVLILCIIVLSAFPIFLPWFEEEVWAVIWAQSALVVFICLRILRFEIRPTADRLERSVKTVKLAFVVIGYACLRYVIGTSKVDGFLLEHIQLLTHDDLDSIKRYGELVIFSALAAYLLRTVTKTVMNKNIQVTARKNEEKVFLKLRKEALEAGDVHRVGEVDDRLSALEEASGGKWLTMIVVPVATSVVGGVILMLAKYLLSGEV